MVAQKRASFVTLSEEDFHDLAEKKAMSLMISVNHFETAPFLRPCMRLYRDHAQEPGPWYWPSHHLPPQ